MLFRSASKTDRGDAIQRFAPYYNGTTSAELALEGGKETRVLISTDVLSEGLNLQDATRLINYDLHWNPVRLMQRIGRVDRRMNPEIEAKIIADHPDHAELRGKVIYWNFLPPEDLDTLLRLYSRVSSKTLRISKVFGIEGKKLLKPEDDYEALRDFTHAYQGELTPLEQMHLEFQKLVAEMPDLEQRLDRLPGRVFSGKEHPKVGAKALFFCYALPAEDKSVVGAGAPAPASAADAANWTTEAGKAAWFLYDLGTGKILEQPEDIAAFIRSTPETPRRVALPETDLRDVRLKVEKHIKNSYLKQIQAPVGVKPVLKCWRSRHHSEHRVLQPHRRGDRRARPPAPARAGQLETARPLRAGSAGLPPRLERNPHRPREAAHHAGNAETSPRSLPVRQR